MSIAVNPVQPGQKAIYWPAMAVHPITLTVFEYRDGGTSVRTEHGWLLTCHFYLPVVYKQLIESHQLYLNLREHHNQLQRDFGICAP